MKLREDKEGQMYIDVAGDVEVIPNPMVRAYGRGPEGAKCRTCQYLCTTQPGANSFYKCRHRGLRGASTDHRVRWDACSKYRDGGE